MRAFLRTATKTPNVTRQLCRPTLLTTTSQLSPKPKFIAPIRLYGAGPPPLTKEFVTERIVDLLKCFDKIEDPEKVTPAANFSTDLKLDSLDIVECLFFIEEEFGIQMPEYVHYR